MNATSLPELTVAADGAFAFSTVSLSGEFARLPRHHGKRDSDSRTRRAIDDVDALRSPDLRDLQAGNARHRDIFRLATFERQRQRRLLANRNGVAVK
jgi:hypothetical protein